MEEWRVIAAVIAEERDAAALVARLVNEGLSVDEALALVRFPHDP
jgi:hypothetical protein